MTRLGGSDRPGEKEADAMSEDKINRQRYRRMGVGGQQAKQRKVGLRLHSLGFPPIVLRRWIQQPAREQEGYIKRRWQCVRVLKQGQARGRMI